MQIAKNLPNYSRKWKAFLLAKGHRSSRLNIYLAIKSRIYRREVLGDTETFLLALFPAANFPVGTRLAKKSQVRTTKH